MQLVEIKKALEEIEKTKDDVFKVSGPILIKTSKDDVRKDLEDKTEFMELRVKTLEKSEQKLKEQFEDFREKLSKLS